MVEARQGNHSLKLSWDNLNRLIQSDNNGQITEYGYDVFGRCLYKKSQDHYGKDSLTLFGWDGDLMVWESKTTGLDLQTNLNRSQNREENPQNNQDYTKHYIYEPNSFVSVLQTGYRGFIQLIKTPEYSQFKSMTYSIHRDPVWSTDKRKNKAELERVAFYHCDQVGTPQTLSNEKGECIWEITLNTWGKTQQVKAQHQDQILEQTNIRFQGQYYDEETGLHYNRYRYYEPHSGRYISKDPIGLLGGLNNSAYVSDPNQWMDPLGLNGKKTIKETFEILPDDPLWLKNEKRELKKQQNDARMRRMEKEISNKNYMYKELEKKRLEQLKNNRRTATEIYLSDDVYVPESHLWTVPEMQRGAIKYFCDRAGGCQSPDYVACSVSGLGVGAVIVKNLHAKLGKGWYISTSKSALEHITKEKLEQIVRAKNISFSGACAVGIIDNIKPEIIRDLSRKQIVEEFVTGGSFTVGAVAAAGLNFVKPLTTKDSPIYGSKSMEIVVGTPSINVDIANTYKVVGID